ncbi:MAG TPA: TetR/AcrR family transcriptional regulator [Bacteroidales bacterium]|nr:TetR/AcrR family transcriptional regulator [Bacteroidales bacterium]
MKEQPNNTQQIIFEAAKKVFIERGFDGARMQQIADEAGINKALLHYYYRSKDRLFDAIFADAFIRFLPNISDIMMSDDPFEIKIKLFVRHYIDLLIDNPHLPVFVMHEIQRKPEMIIKIIRRSGINPAVAAGKLQQEIDEGKIRPIPLQHLIINMIGLCVFPFIGRPILEGFVFTGNKEAYDRFLEDRKTMVADFIINSIRKSN